MDLSNRFVIALVLNLALVAGAPGSGLVGINVSAQEPDVCALVTDDEIGSLAPEEAIAKGISGALPSFGLVACHYTWGTGIDRFKLDISIQESSRMFPGMTPEQIKQRLVESVKVGTDETVLSEIGEAAVVKPDSAFYVTATAFMKGRILQVRLDGLTASAKRDQVIGLLKAAASRL